MEIAWINPLYKYLSSKQAPIDHASYSVENDTPRSVALAYTNL